MKTKFKKINFSTIFIISTLVFLVPLAYYILYWVPSQQKELSFRYLRVAAMMSEQIQTQAQNIATVLEKADLNLEEQQDSHKEILEKHVGSLLSLEENQVEAQIIPGLKKEEFFLDVKYNSSKNQLIFSVEKDIPMGENQGRAQFSLSIPVQKFLDQVYWGDEFEDILILNEDGKVLYSFNCFQGAGIKSGLRISRLENIFTGNGKDKTKSQLPSKKNIHSYALELDIAQSKFKLFLQPIPLDFVSEQDSDRHWYLGGLLSSSTFDRRSRRISNTILLFFVLLVAAGFIGYPLFRLSLTGPGDSLRKRDLLFLLLSFSVFIPVVIFLIFSGTNHRMNANNNRDNLAGLTKDIHDRFTGEIHDAYRQLKILVNEKEKFLKPGPYRANLPAELDKQGKLIYPTFDMAYIIDKYGQQIYKNVPGNSPITLHNVSSRQYFKSIRENKYWYTSHGNPLYLEPVYSKSSGQYEINLSIPCNDRLNPELAVAGISFRPLSTLGPVLPFSYGFAIIDSSGKVVFHSNPRLNAKENFFAECSNTGMLMAAMKTRAIDHLQLSYQGKKREMCIFPIQNIPWTLVVFQDSSISGSRNLEKIYRSSLRYFLYLIMLLVAIILMILLFWIIKKITLSGTTGLFERTPLWPDNSLALKYFGIALVNFFIFFLLIIQLYITESPFRGSLVIPILVLPMVYSILNKALQNQYPPSRTMNFTLLRRITGWFLCLSVLFLFFLVFKTALLDLFIDYKSFILIPLVLYFFILKLPNESQRPGSAKKWIFRNAHALMIYSLLLLVFVFPTLLFFNISHKEERLTYAKHYQACLARDYIQWEKNFVQDYPSQASFIEKSAIIQKKKLEERGIYMIPLYKTSIIHESLGRFQLALFKQGSKSIDEDAPVGRSMYSSILLFISKIIPFDNNYSEKIRYFYADSSADRSMIWKHKFSSTKENLSFKYDEKAYLPYNKDDERADPVWVVSNIPRLRGQAGNSWLLLLSAILAVFFLTLVLYPLTSLVCRYIFLTGIHIDKEESTIISLDELEIKKGLFLYFPLVQEDFEELCKKDDCLVINGEKKEKIQEFIKNIPGKPQFLVFDNFDYLKHDSAYNLEKLVLLENLVYNKKISVTLITCFDPIQYFEFENPEVEERWKQVLAFFKPFYLVDKSMKVKNPPSLGLFHRNYYEKEIHEIPYLSGVRLQVAKILKKAEDNGYEGFKDQVYQVLHPVYQQIWLTSTNREKMVLIQLAKNGLLNIKNRETIRSLMIRGLVKHIPLRLMNKSFRQFILNVEDTAGLQEWQRMQKESNWAKVRRPFLFLVTAMILFLVFTQPDMLKSWLVWVPAISGAIPTLLRLFDNLSGAAPPPAE